MLTSNFQTHAEKFEDLTCDAKVRLALVNEVRESVEIVHTSEYGNFLSAFVPAFADELDRASSGMLNPADPAYKMR